MGQGWCVGWSWLFGCLRRWEEVGVEWHVFVSVLMIFVWTAVLFGRCLMVELCIKRSSLPWGSVGGVVEIYTYVYR